MGYSAETTLTAREREVLQLVSHGFSAKMIARRIAIAPRTVERHIDNLRVKIGARNRTHMIARACAAGHLVITSSTHGDIPASRQDEALEPAWSLVHMHTQSNALFARSGDEL